VTVIDNGVGFDPDKIADDKNHVGMKNTQKRLEVMCKGELEIDSTPGGGTTVRMIIPD
jgi:signal transduction histidine kinase